MVGVQSQTVNTYYSMVDCVHLLQYGRRGLFMWVSSTCTFICGYHKYLTYSTAQSTDNSLGSPLPSVEL